jgi:ferredoxin
VAYKIDKKTCLKCGICIDECPEQAIIIEEMVTEKDGLKLYTVGIDPEKCNDCGVCVSHEWWCPAKAIAAA